MNFDYLYKQKKENIHPQKLLGISDVDKKL
jgi:hypothetical protein